MFMYKGRMKGVAFLISFLKASAARALRVALPVVWKEWNDRLSHKCPTNTADTAPRSFWNSDIV
jgi:hypothetical protein